MENFKIFKNRSNAKTFVLFILPFIILNSTSAQDDSIEIHKTSFTEINTGIALIATSSDGVDGLAPGLSFVYGQAFMNKDNNFFEYQIGIALPSFVTGKIGVGKKIKNNIRVSTGVRPFPFTLYTQANFPIGKSGNLSLALEGNPIDHQRRISIASVGNFNIGYRWILKSKK